jgi:uncharacterized membrane protein
VVFEKTDALVFHPIESENETKKMVASMDQEKVSKHQEQHPEPKPYIQQEPTKTFWENFRENNPDLEKFIGENLINKIGILILVLGISYFVKYAIDKDWINEPARVGIGMLSGALIMGIAHKLRQKIRSFQFGFCSGCHFGVLFYYWDRFSQLSPVRTDHCLYHYGVDYSV